MVLQLVAALTGTHKYPVPANLTQRHPASPLCQLCSPPSEGASCTFSCCESCYNFLSLIKWDGEKEQSSLLLQCCAAAAAACWMPRHSGQELQHQLVEESRKGIGSENCWRGVGMLLGSSLPVVARSPLLTPRVGEIWGGGGKHTREEPRSL